MTAPDASPTDHEGPIELGRASNLGAPAGVGLLKADFVRYPGCQQLKLWLPQPGDRAGSGYGELRVVSAAGVVVDRAGVAQRLNGAVQLLFDTLAWPPGHYTLEIDHTEGWRHVLPLRKLQEAEPTVGEVRPRSDDDLLLRAQVTAQMAARLSRRVVYEGSQRAGVFTYIAGPLHIRFSQEMGCDGCRALLEVPSVQTWEAATGTPLAQRDEIVQFVAEQATRQVGSRFEIGDVSIAIF